MYVLTKPTAAKARPVLAVRDIVICSVILLVLCLQNKLQGCQSAISAATWRGFSCFSLVAMLLALNCTLNPTSAFQHLVLIYTSRLLSGTAQKSVKDHLCRSQSHSVLPATDQSLYSLIVHEAPLLCQLISLLVRGLLWIQEAFISFSTPPEFRSHPSFLPLPLPFSLSSYSVIWESFFLLLGVQNPCYSSAGLLWELLLCRCILDAFVGRDELHILLLLCHLDSSKLINFIYIYTHMFVCMCVCVHLCVYIYIYVCVCMCVCVHLLSHFSHVWLYMTIWPIVCQATLSMGFSRQEYWNGLQCLSPRDLPHPGIKPRSPALQEDSLLVVTSEKKDGRRNKTRVRD